MVQYATLNPLQVQTVRAPAMLSTGLGNATAGTRYVGATASGSPTSGYFKVGDFCVDQTGAMWICTVAGDPGTWVEVGGSGGVTPAAAYVWRSTSQSIPSGSTTTITWPHFQTTDTTVFGTDTSAIATAPYHNTSGDSFIYFVKKGLYYVSATCEFESLGNQYMQVTNPGSQWWLDGEASYNSTTEAITSNTGLTGVGSGFGLSSHGMYYVDSTDGPGIIEMQVEQASGVAKNVTQATLGIMYLGGPSSDLTTIY